MATTTNPAFSALPRNDSPNTASPVLSQDVNLDNIIPQDDKKTNVKLAFIAIVAFIIIIIVVILAFTVEFKDGDTIIQHSYGHDSGWDWEDCGGVDIYLQETDSDEVCGTLYTSWYLNTTNCGYLCYQYYDYDSYEAYYIHETNECYCFTYDDYYELKYSSTTTTSTTMEPEAEPDARDARDASNTDNGTDICYSVNTTIYSVDRYEISEWVCGRPYYTDIIQNKIHKLEGDVIHVPCDEYTYHDDIKWKAFILNSNHSNSDIASKWIKIGISEYSAIATFSKFNLDLMSIGSPLWLIQLSNNAQLDEIRHTQIAFDIANIYTEDDQLCVAPNTFPNHSIDINGDVNRISLDVAIGGCFGETMSALKMIHNEYKYYNIIDDYMYDISMDEIKHSALAWTTIKWIIQSNDVIIGNQGWWINEINKRKQSSNDNDNDNYIYDIVFTSLIQTLWNTKSIQSIPDYQMFYHKIVAELQNHFNVMHSTDSSRKECAL